MELTRRDFLKVAGAAAVAGKVLSPEPAHAFTGRYATIIDLTRCDGCRGESMPRCVSACREYNRPRFPEPVKNIQPYWPHKFYEDWSKKRDVYNTFTPYNWIFVQKVAVEGQGDIFVPRRCMHCDNPPCVSLCPFGALSKEKEGNTVISDALCFGGAKCRDVCPWHIPQRQAGVGLYLKIMPKFAGGGVMYKCDLCKDLVARGNTPACVAACTEHLGERMAMFFGQREVIYRAAAERAEREKLFIYGDKQNGGTSTLYLSRVPFDTIDSLLGAKKEKFRMAASMPNPLEEPHNLAKYFLIGSVSGAVAGIAGALLTRTKKAGTSGEHEDNKT
jgi:formate dehydrogenase iron-sulfur subunit